MARGPQGGGSGGGGSSVEEDAKDFLDKIGQQVHEEIVKKEAQKRSNRELAGNLASASIFGVELVSTDDPCSPDYTTRFDAYSNRYPCGNTNVDRFPDNDGAECDNSKIKGNKGKEDNSEGACAPYRRLSLCNKNFQNNNNDHSSNAKHDLLLDVCMAANYEAQSLITYHDKHELTNVGSQICTVLARSFADIGDIVRGKDLYLGKKKKKKTETERDQLEQKLKGIFKKIYEGLTGGVKDHYQDTDNYYELREDWWTANRETVWKAITCKADNSNRYFRPTCGDSTRPSVARNKCRCSDKPKVGKAGGDVNIVPTYFDYVPQFLRWFEEWAEDFCRKKKIYVGIVKKYCRGQYKDGKERYCSRNGYDCEKTKRAIGKYRMGKQCISCLYACNPYVEWIDNQRKQFEKQKKKYDEEITRGGSSKKPNTRGGSDHKGYEKIFYDELNKREYGTVDKFLNLLNNEKACKEVQDDKEGGIINFSEEHSGNSNDASQGTFYRSEYCQPCPVCGVKKKDGGSGSGWEKKNDKCNIKLYKPKDGQQGTLINFLYSGDEETEIEKKLKEFCETKNGSDGGGSGDCGGNSDPSLCEPWQCYQSDQLEKDKDGVDDDDDDLEYDQEVKKAGGLCILQKTNGLNVNKQKTFHDFFYYWVAHMLKDSIYWRTKKLDKCINNTNKSKACKKNKCNSDCDCFLKWVKKKETEWENIKIHFLKQDDFKDWKHNQVLELLLKKDELLTSLQEAYGDTDDIKRIRKMLDEEEEKNEEAAADGTDNENNTTIDKLLQHELKEAEECIKKPTCLPPPRQSAARAETHNENATPRSEEEEAAAEEEEEDDEEDEDGDEVEKEETQEEEKAKKEGSEPPQPGPPATKVEVDKVNVCKTVADVFSDPTKFSDACTLKYVTGKNYGWRCVAPSGPTSDKSDASGGDKDGAICIPPRRRKLYVGHLQKWAEKTQLQTQEDGEAAQGNGVSTSPQVDAASKDPKVELLKAFVESAAIETFFAWHKYKQDKIKEDIEKRQGEIGLVVRETSADTEQKQLETGDIPDEFKRQMFYTLGDYRDILVRGGGNNTSDTKDGGDSSNNNNIVLLASGTKEEKEKMKQLQTKIKEHINSGSTPAPKTGNTTAQQWWQANGPHIWDGMLCALTYNTDSGEKGTSNALQQNDDVYKKFFGTPNGNPGLPGIPPGTTGTPNGTTGTYTTRYQYNTVKLEENSGDGPKLTEFVKRPTYFRWLEEWGEEFCRKRTHKLDIIEKECYKDGDEKCSGDGLKCKEKVPDNKEIFKDFDCSTCARHCSFYKKWITRKKDEFEKQNNAYGDQKEKAKNNNYDKQFCDKLTTTSPTAGDFLERLKNGPCKKENGKDNDEYEIKFDDKEKTFKHTKHCDPCSEFKIKCQNGNCKGEEKNKCNGKTPIDAKEIGTMRSSTEEVDMYVSDNSKKDFESDLKEACQTSGIFKGIRKDVWKCGEVCGVDICNLKKKDNIREEGDKKYITMKELLKRWLEYFFEDYNRINKKLKTCTKNGKGYICIKECVDKWIKLKKKEWQNINNNYIQKYKNVGNTLTNFLETLIPGNDVKKATGSYEKLSHFKTSCHCNGADSSKSAEDGKERDVVECLFQKLEKKIEQCKKKHPQPSGDTQPNCDEKSTPDVEDEDDALHEETEVKMPKICKDVLPKTKTVVEKETCDAPPAEEEKKKEKEKEEQEEASRDPAASKPEPAAGTDVEQTPVQDQAPEDVQEDTPKVKPETPAVPSTPAATRPTKPAAPIPQPPRDDPWEPLKNAMLSSTIMWSIGIGFATFTYFFLKKKTKASVGNLFQILQIPKSDYGTPTPKSSNRYIPYVSDRHKGKTYIYMEGDSSGDEDKYAFMSDTTDVTSSESEYEEMDINDIYVPGSPKYKTLIEVVLEPSKRDTQNDIHNDIPSDIPNSDTPPPITDDEWNQLKKDFISNMLQNTQNTEPNILRDNVDNNTHPTPSRHTLHQKPFIMSIHDRNLLNGEEYNYDMSTNSGENNVYSGIDPTSDNRDPYSDKKDPISGTKDPISDNHHPYSGIDLINAALNGDYDLYDEILKRKENELFGTNHVKQTSTHSVAKNTNSDPVMNQLDLFHKWLDRHRDMCEKWDTNNKKEELLDKLKEEWNKDNNKHNGENTINKTLNTDVSIHIHMDDPKPTNEFSNMDTYPNNSSMDNILDDLEKYNEPYYDVQDDIYYDVNDHDASNVDSNNMDVPSKVKIEMSVKNTQMMEGKYPIGDVWDI
ncbi:hypothetical protein C923_04152 [Plasmodium falciparum UGT5.1]|uniref:Erythrocyte membrane protein 1 n=1 Tax=Plasmodium falciparum UGT5.1 TaxID=1237627 RepID=W7J951_PLAFA|nr:hypothetical protein C923_04152 [Plasmodium falciparum UGT5.1]